MIMPYYDHAGITIYHGDCRDILPSLVRADVVLTDPPYDEQTHAGARTLSKEGRARASDGRRSIQAVGVIEMGFDPLLSVTFTADLWRMAERWCVVFCSLEQLGDYRIQAGDAYVRSGFWHRPDGAPQMSGDRPGQPGEGLAILHRPGRKRWNGGGHHAFWEVSVVKGTRDHPTQKPEELMVQLVRLFSEPNELVLDPYMGSGTTLLAAKRLGRRAIGIELEERYCAIAAERLSQAALPLSF